MKKSFVQILPNNNEVNSEIGNKLEDFEILQVLGEGTYGFVAKVQSKLNFGIYALKKYILSSVSDDEKKYILNERIFMKKLDHENVVKLYCDFQEKDNLYLVMEYMDGGDLYTFIDANRSLEMSIDEEKLWNIYEQCLRGLVYLHRMGLIHRDIKPANLLMNSKGEIKYTDFNVSAIINSDRAREFTKNKNEEEHLINNNTIVGSGSYKAPEILDDNSIFQEYDLKIDVYSLGITFCTLAFYQMNIPGPNELNNYRYSKELIDIIMRMIEPEPMKRMSSLQIYNYFIKLYVQKYVHSTGFMSCVQSLYDNPIIFNYFCNNNIMYDNRKNNMPITSKLSELFTEIYFSRQKNYSLLSPTNNNRDGKSFNHLIYDLRKLLLKNDTKIKERENDEINPIIIITFLLKKLHEELNIYKGKLGKLSMIYAKLIKGENPKSESYECYKKFYTSNFQSLISDNFFGLIKTKTICNQCKNSSYSFKVLCYIPFNVKILVENYPNKQNLNLYDAFDCLNKNYIELDKKQYIQCKFCKTVMDHIEFKQFYNLSKNLVILFDRGENDSNKKYIDFNEDFLLNGDYVENFQNINVYYKLMSVIIRIEGEQDNNKRNPEKFVCFRRINNDCYVSSLPNGDAYSLNQVKSMGTVMILFYYSDKGISNFNDDQNINNSVPNNNISGVNFNNNNFNNMGNNNNFNNFNNFNNGNMNMTNPNMPYQNMPNPNMNNPNMPNPNMFNPNMNNQINFNMNNNNFMPMNNNQNSNNNNNFNPNFQQNPNFNNQPNNLNNNMNNK